jgi:HK97 family phage portal protein
VQFLLDLFVQGECLLVPYRPSLGSPPTELWPIPWKYVTTIEDASGIIGYRVMAGGVMATLAPEQVVHVWLPGRVSPLEALARTLALEDASMDLQNATMANGVTPRAVFTAAKLTRNPDDETKLRNELEKLYSGPANGGRFALLGGEWSVDTLGVSAADVALIDQRKLSREEVIGAYGLTLMQMGLSEKAAYASMLEARRAFYVDAVGGAVELVEDELQAQLVAPEPAWDGLYLKFNVDEILRPYPEARARMHLMMQQSGTNAANERRRYEELPPADPLSTENPYDLPLAPVNMQVPGQTPAADAADPASVPATDPLVAEALHGAPTPLHLDEED